MTVAAGAVDAAVRPAAIVFDAGLTLIHASGQVMLDELTTRGVAVSGQLTAWDATRALVLAAEARHLPLPSELNGDQRVAAMWAALLGLTGSDPMDAGLSAMARPDFYCDLDPDAADCLSALRGAGVRLGVVSNSAGTVRQDLASFDLLRYFTVVVDSTEAGVEKPNPAIFRVALQRLGVPGSRCWYVGDGLVNDILGAQAAGYGNAVLYDRFDCYAHLPGIARVRNLSELPGLLPVP